MKKISFFKKVNEIVNNSKLNKIDILLVLFVFLVLYFITQFYNYRFKSIDYDYQLRLINGVYEVFKEEKGYAERILDEFYYEELYHAESDEVFNSIDQERLMEYLTVHISAYSNYDEMFVITKDGRMYASNENEIKVVDIVKKYGDKLSEYLNSDREYVYLEKNDMIYSNKQILKKYLNADGEVICLVGIEFNYKMIINSLEQYRNLFYPKNMIIEDNLGKIFFTSNGHDDITNAAIAKFNAIINKLDKIAYIDELTDKELMTLLNDPEIINIVSVGDNKRVYTFNDSSWMYTKDLKLRVGIIDSSYSQMNLIDSMHYGEVTFIIIKMVLAIVAVKYIFLDRNKKNYRRSFKRILLIMGSIIIGILMLYNRYLSDYSYMKNVKTAFNTLFMVEKLATNELEKKRITNFIYNVEKNNISSKEYFNYKITTEIEPSNITKSVLSKRKNMLNYDVKIVKPDNIVMIDSDDVKIENDNQLTEEYLRNFRLEGGYRMIVDLKLKNTVMYEINDLFVTLNKLNSGFKPYNINKSNDVLTDLYINNDAKSIAIEGDKYILVEDISNMSKMSFEYEDVIIYVDKDTKMANINVYVDSDDVTKKKIVYTYNFINYMEDIWVINLLSVIICISYLTLSMMIFKKFASKYDDAENDNEKVYTHKEELESDEAMEVLREVYTEEEQREIKEAKEANDEEERNRSNMQNESLNIEYDEDNLISAKDYAKYENELKK